MNQSRPLKFKNKNLTQIFFDNFYFLLFPLFIEIYLLVNPKTRIYGITLFFLITLLTIILYKIHKHRLYKKIIELTESKEFKYKISLSLYDFHPHPFIFKNYVDVPYLVFCNDKTIKIIEIRDRNLFTGKWGDESTASFKEKIINIRYEQNQNLKGEKK